MSSAPAPLGPAGPPRSDSRASAAVAAVVWLATLSVDLATLWAVFGTEFLERATTEPDGLDADQLLLIRAALLLLIAVTLAYATVGALLAGRASARRIASLLLAGGFLFALVPFGFMVGGHLTLLDPSSAINGVIFLLGPAALAPGYVSILPGLAIAYPDGRLPSARWRWPVGVALGVAVLSTILQLVRPGPIAETSIRNPLGIDALPGWLGPVADIGVIGAVLAITVLGMAAVVVRYRRGITVERQQQRWFLAAAVIAGTPLAISIVPGLGGPGMLAIAVAALMLVPVAVWIAVTRYRLYEIDTLINRSLVYIPLVGIVGGLYAASVALLQRVFVAATGDTSDAAAVISALILASVFTPIRNALQAFVDRRFKPARSGVAKPTEWQDPAFRDAVAAIVRQVLTEERPQVGAPAASRSRRTPPLTPPQAAPGKAGGHGSERPGVSGAE